MGLRPTGAWQAGEEVLDRHGLLLPTTATGPGELGLRIGLYDSQSGQRLPLLDGQDAIELGRCDIE